jgi:hypothetical protein
MLKVLKPLIILFSSVTLLGCAISDPWKNPSGEYSRSVVIDIYKLGKQWSSGYIENKVHYTKDLPLGLENDIYLVGYKNYRLTENDNEKIAIYRGLEFGRSLGYSCMVITPEKTLGDIEKVEFSSNSSQGTISVSPSIDRRSFYGSINLSRSGGVYHFNRHRITPAKCTKVESDMPGKTSCSYFPEIDHLPIYYAIYPKECKFGKDLNSVKIFIDRLPNKEKFNILDIDEKIIEYENFKKLHIQ